jgi:hypothetical protein
MAPRLRLPKSVRRARRVFRVEYGRRSPMYLTQKREAIRQAARWARQYQPRVGSADVKMLGPDRDRWTLIAQVSWSEKREAPALREL